MSDLSLSRGRKRRLLTAGVITVGVMASTVGFATSPAHAGPGGSLQVTVESATTVAQNGVCFELIQPGKKNSPDVVVASLGPSGADGTNGHIAGSALAPGSYIGRFIDCGANSGFASFYYGGTYNKAKATRIGITDLGFTNLGIQLLLDFGTAGSISGSAADASNPGAGAPSVNVQAYTAKGSVLLAQTCTNQDGLFSVGEMPNDVGGIKIRLGSKTGCSNDSNFVSQWIGGTSYATATPISVNPAGDQQIGSTTLTPITKSHTTVTSVTFTGTPTDPTITVTGTGFGAKAPKPNPVTRPCNEPDVAGNGYDYANNVVLWDTNDAAGWQVGYPGDCIGVNFVSYSTNQIVFTLGDWYRIPGNVGQSLLNGDHFTVRIKGAPHTGIVSGLS